MSTAHHLRSDSMNLSLGISAGLKRYQPSTTLMRAHLCWGRRPGPRPLLRFFWQKGYLAFDPAVVPHGLPRSFVEGIVVPMTGRR